MEIVILIINAAVYLLNVDEKGGDTAQQLRDYDGIALLL